MRTAKKLLLATALTVAFGITAHSAFATEADVEAVAITRAAITLTPGTDIDFGTIDFGAAQAGDIVLNPVGGAVDVSAATDITASGAPTAGVLTVGGDGETDVGITCLATATLTDDVTGAASITLSDVMVSVDGGAAVACDGLGVTETVVDLAVTPAPVLTFGGTLDVTANAIDAGNFTYSTENTGGVPVTVRVVYQ